MKIDLVFLIVLGIVVAYLFVLHRVETMADVGSLEQIKEAVKQVYLADVEAIRNLSNVATKLQAEGLTVPGNLKTNIISSTDNISVSNKTNEGGRLRILNELKSGKADHTNDWSIWNMTGPYGNKLSFWRYNGDGKNAGSTLDLMDDGNINIPGNLKTNIISSTDNISVSNKTNEGGRLRILNELKSGKADQTNDWSIWNMTGPYGNKLSFWRYNGDGKNAGPALDLTDDGTVVIPGNLKVGSTVITEDILKRIINQQQYAGFAVDGGGTTMPLYEGTYKLYDNDLFDAWTNDKWDVIYINRGWKITLWHHGVGDSKAAEGENRKSNVPIKLILPANSVSSYRAEWIGY